jgi:hypothetical protein
VNKVFVDQEKRGYVSHSLVTPEGIVRENESSNCSDVYMCLDEYPAGTSGIHEAGCGQ